VIQALEIRLGGIMNGYDLEFERGRNNGIDIY
jgi:hypothetical protein